MGATPERGAHGGGGELVVEGGQAAALAGRHPPPPPPGPPVSVARPRPPSPRAFRRRSPGAASRLVPGRGREGGAMAARGAARGWWGRSAGHVDGHPPPTWGKPGSTRCSTHPGVFVQ